MDRRRRNLWPLPGGASSYARTLTELLKAVDEGATRSDLERLVIRLSPVVQSQSTVRGYAAVPVALGLAERTSDRQLALTEPGHHFLEQDGLQVLGTVLRDRILGVEELLEELRASPDTTFRAVSDSLAKRGISWNHPMALRYRVWWLVAAEAVEARRVARSDLLRLTTAGEALVAKNRS